MLLIPLLNKFLALHTHDTHTAAALTHLDEQVADEVSCLIAQVHTGREPQVHTHNPAAIILQVQLFCTFPSTTLAANITHERTELGSCGSAELLNFFIHMTRDLIYKVSMPVLQASMGS
eukprot:1141825-Pelagomonas_calceolata.AAC.4